MTPISSGGLSALSSHRFLMRAALAACVSFAWVFVLQYFFVLYGNLRDAFVHTIMLYALAQVVTILLTPYSAGQLQHGVRSRMMAGVFLCMISLAVLASALSGMLFGITGILAFAILWGAYRAFYWTPYQLEKDTIVTGSRFPQDFFIALMPAIAGYALIDGIVGATVLLIAGVSILIASLAPLSRVPEMYERFIWSYREAFAEIFEVKYNRIVEPAFIEGIQAAALMLLWPLAVFVIVGLSYLALGLVLSGTLLVSALIRPKSTEYLRRRTFLHATIAATSWLFRLVVASPFAVVLVDVYGSSGNRPGDYLSLDHAADNGTYLDEYTVLKEISMGLGRLFMCIFAIICMTFFSLPVGLAAAFVLAAAAAAVGVLVARRAEFSN